MLRVAVFCILLLLAVTSDGKVFRWVDPEGRVTFSDRPVADTLPAPSSGASAPVVPPTPASSPDTPLLGPYRAFAVASPEPGQSVRQVKDSNKLSLRFVIDPPMIEGNRLEISMDGEPIRLEAAGDLVPLSDISYGTHRVQAIMRNSAGTIVARTAPVEFQFLKPIPPGVLQ